MDEDMVMMKEWCEIEVCWLGPRGSSWLSWTTKIYLLC